MCECAWESKDGKESRTFTSEYFLWHLPHCPPVYTYQSRALARSQAPNTPTTLETEFENGNPVVAMYTRATHTLYIATQAPNTPTTLEIEFEKGDPVGINGVRMSPATILTKLNEVCVIHVGRSSREDLAIYTTITCSLSHSHRHGVTHLVDGPSQFFVQLIIHPPNHRSVVPMALGEWTWWSPVL